MGPAPTVEVGIGTEQAAGLEAAPARFFLLSEISGGHVEFVLCWDLVNSCRFVRIGESQA